MLGERGRIAAEPDARASLLTAVIHFSRDMLVCPLRSGRRMSPLDDTTMLAATSLRATASPLGIARRGFRGTISAISIDSSLSDLPPSELELRLLELGLTEGARIEILHEGAFGRDPIAVRVDGMTVALRRREAMAVWVS